jgi:alanyl-tRNA synthetase
MRTAFEIRRQYIEFFKKHGHKEIPSASLIPENDPTVLFTTAGMHPLVPYLMGEPHPAGKRLVDVQKCVRTDDIDEVGDATHCTFFEMLGNWSLGDYFKKEAIEMSYELLTLPWEKGGFGLDKSKLAVTCFAGDKDAPKDEESANMWKSLGIPEDRIAFLPKKNNWWGPAGQTGPCGPDTEMFYWTGDGSAPKKFDPDDAKWVEIWNDVFMQYNKNADGTFEPLKQKNVDTGLGFERLISILQGKESPFETELFKSAMDEIFVLANKPIGDLDPVSVRIVADHLRTATFILGDVHGISPSNVDQGYIVRRLIRRAIRHAVKVGIKPAERTSKVDFTPAFTPKIAAAYIDFYKDVYPELEKNRARILRELEQEEKRFCLTLNKGLKELHQFIEEKKQQITGAEAFYIFETYGFPIEMVEEELKKSGVTFSREEFQKTFDAAFKKHQEQSRAGAEQKFAGGLADHSEAVTMHHTATHLLHQALRMVLGTHVAQKGSNVTAERLRFDFSHPAKMIPEELKKVEDIVNEQIAKDLPVKMEMLTVDEAKKSGAIGLFEDKYEKLGNQVKMYSIGSFSKEICGGPHVEHIGTLKHFKILKEEASSSGVRRIKAVAEGAK